MWILLSQGLPNNLQILTNKCLWGRSFHNQSPTRILAGIVRSLHQLITEVIQTLVNLSRVHIQRPLFGSSAHSFVKKSCTAKQSVYIFSRPTILEGLKILVENNRKGKKCTGDEVHTYHEVCSLDAERLICSSATCSMKPETAIDVYLELLNSMPRSDFY